MRILFSIGIGSALMITAMAQQRTPPPVTTAPPPAIPNLAPAIPQPGVATGVAGGIGSPLFPDVPRVRLGSVPGDLSVSRPFPVVMAPGTYPIYPEPFDPLDVVLQSELLRMLEEPAPNAGVSQGRPGGLGVTITGGSGNVPAVTNALAPANATGGIITNSTYR
jgi:hypothetical protein